MSHVEIWGRSVPGSGNNANANALWWEHAGLDVDCDMHQLHGQVVGEWVIECLKHLYLLPPAEGGEGVRDTHSVCVCVCARARAPCVPTCVLQAPWV